MKKLGRTIRSFLQRVKRGLIERWQVPVRASRRAVPRVRCMFGAGLPTPPTRETEGLKATAVVLTRETSGRQFRRGRVTRAEQPGGSPWLETGFITDNLKTHLGRDVFNLLGTAYAPFLQGVAVLLVLWLILFWMYRRKLFLRL